MAVSTPFDPVKSLPVIVFFLESASIFFSITSAFNEGAFLIVYKLLTADKKASGSESNTFASAIFTALPT